MKRLIILPACLLMLMLGTGLLPAQESMQEPEDHLKAGILLYEEGYSETFNNQRKLDEAVTEFNQALVHDPNSAKARYYLGLTCLAMDTMSCAEKQYRLLKDLDKGMAEILKAKILEYRYPKRYEHVGTKGGTWTPPEEEKTPVSETTPAPETTGSETPESQSPDSKSEDKAPEATADGKGCEIVSFSTYDEPGEMRRFAQGGTMFEEQKRCVTVTIRNTSRVRAWATNYMVEARFSDGDTLRERIADGISGMNAVEPGNTVTGSACFNKSKATITVVQCGMW